MFGHVTRFPKGDHIHKLYFVGILNLKSDQKRSKDTWLKQMDRYFAEIGYEASLGHNQRGSGGLSSGRQVEAKRLRP